jgi:hypothetical protein
MWKETLQVRKLYLYFDLTSHLSPLTSHFSLLTSHLSP